MTSQAGEDDGQSGQRHRALFAAGSQNKVASLAV